MKLLVLVVALLAAPALAEAGLPPGLCGDATCSCGADTCTCGQSCRYSGTGQNCADSSVVYCATDEGCAVACGSFVCAFNQCVPGQLADGGNNRPAPPGPVAPMVMRSWGCAAAPGDVFALFAVWAAAAVRRRQTVTG